MEVNSRYNNLQGEPVLQMKPDSENTILLLKVSAGRFLKAFSENRKLLSKWEFTAPASDNDYTKCECYLSDSEKSGFAIDENGYLSSVFSNESWRGFVTMASPIMKKAKALSCIAGTKSGEKLAELYEKELHFTRVARTVDDTLAMREHYGDEYIEYFKSKNGTPYHIFLVNKEMKTDVGLIDGYYNAKKYTDKILSEV